MPNPNTLNMLYKVASGAVKEEHYGLALAKVLPFPPALLKYATRVAQVLNERAEKRRKTCPSVFVQRRRRLILGLKEHLVQAQNGNMQGETLADWLRQLQSQFVMRMNALDEEEKKAREDEAEEKIEGENNEASGAMHFVMDTEPEEAISRTSTSTGPASA